MARQTLRIELTDVAKRQLTALSRQDGMSQVALMSRLVEWFVAQDTSMQGIVMKHYPVQIRGEIVRIILKRMSTK